MKIETEIVDWRHKPGGLPVDERVNFNWPVGGRFDG